MVGGDLPERVERAVRGVPARGAADALPPLPVQYADYAVWRCQEWVRGRVLAGRRRTGPRRCDGNAGAGWRLPTDHPRPAVQDYAGAAVGVASTRR